MGGSGVTQGSTGCSLGGPAARVLPYIDEEKCGEEGMEELSFLLSKVRWAWSGAELPLRDIAVVMWTLSDITDTLRDP